MQAEDLRKLQKTEADILYQVADICDRHNICYFLIDGTLLGAVRHNGFIPWDDDVDIAMPREEYERFITIAIQELPSQYKLRNYRTSEDYEKLVTRVVNEKVKLYHDSYTGGEQVQNAWIDIFPLDGMPNNKVLFQLHKYYFLWTRLLYHYSCFETGVNLFRKDRSTIQIILIWIGKTFKFGRNMNTKKLLDKMETCLKKYSYEKAGFIVNAYSSYMFKETYKREWYGKREKHIFEDYELWIPGNYDEILTHLYGDYMTPPKNTDVKHNITRIDFGE